MAQDMKAAVVVASASGIGLATCRRLAQAGYGLCMIDTHEDNLMQQAAALRDASAQIEALVADATDPGTAPAFTAAAMSRFGRIDALACISGGAGDIPMHQVDDIPLEQWETVMRLNLTSTFLSCQHVVPVMRNQGHGRIVCLSSTVAQGRLAPVGTMGARVVYSTAKAGILGFVKQLAKDVGEDRITVNAVLPWLTFGEPGTKVRDSFYAQTEEYQARTLSMSPQKRPVAADGMPLRLHFCCRRRLAMSRVSRCLWTVPF